VSLAFIFSGIGCGALRPVYPRLALRLDFALGPVTAANNKPRTQIPADRLHLLREDKVFSI